MITRKELAEWYDCGKKTIRKKLLQIGITHTCLITPLEFEQFKARFGEPVNKRVYRSR